LKHELPLTSELLISGLARRWRRELLSKISHKNTLFHTVAHFRGCQEGGQALSVYRNSDFINEMKDLADILEEGPHQNISTN
jgi:hypothetical protein